MIGQMGQQKAMEYLKKHTLLRLESRRVKGISGDLKINKISKKL
jgi:hypothetical protein